MIYRNALAAAAALMLIAMSAGAQGQRSNVPTAPDVSLLDTVTPSALRDLRNGRDVTIAARATNAVETRVTIRVTTSLGNTSMFRAAPGQALVRCRYPRDFAGAPRLLPCMLCIDASADGAFDASRVGHFQAEAALIVYDSAHGAMPDLPTGFTASLRDGAGRVDRKSSSWAVDRTLVDLYMRSRAAHLTGVGQPAFDLDRPADLLWFKENLSLYDFRYRDRDWSQPLDHRVARTFWKSVWSTWFNSSNDNPIDGRRTNAAHSNYLPYAFTNDLADVLIMYEMRAGASPAAHDDLHTLCSEGLLNLIAMQYRGAGNFALQDVHGHRENYTAGAFQYGMFIDGSFMTEGNGWFSNPEFNDYVGGGVLNGRAVWALGEALNRRPAAPEAAQAKVAMALAARFCLHDALAFGYAHTTGAGHVYWRDAGEHAYLLLGMLAACTTAQGMTVYERAGRPVALREACEEGLNALVDLAKSDHGWSIYPNVDSMAIAALADGVERFPNSPSAAAWRRTMVRATDAWCGLKVDPKAYPGPPVHFGLRTGPNTMTFNWHSISSGSADRNVIYLYQSGHWIHALSRAYAVTGDTRYRERAEQIIRSLCGANPWQVRLLSEIGGVYNWIEDTDGDGVEDCLKQDLYPEATAYCQIGIMHLLTAFAHPRHDR